MTEKNTAGLKELIFAVLWAAAVLVAYDFADTAMRLAGKTEGRNMILTICAVIVGCVIVYFAMTRYAAVFTYETGKKSIRLTRKIGHREKSVEIRNKDIVSFSVKKPRNAPKIVYKMRKTMFSDKNVRYLVFKGKNGLEMAEFEPSEKMAEEIAAKVKEGLG